MDLRVGRWLLGCLLVLAPAGCAQAAPSASPTRAGSAEPTPPRSSEPAAVTTEDNVATTRRISAWLLHAVPMPPGAREWHRSPTVHYRKGTLGIGPSDPRFTRTTWWTVALPASSLRSWLRGHVPRGLRAEADSGGSVESRGVWETDQSFRAPSTTAHTAGWVNFAFMPSGPGLVVRVDTFVGARFARTALVPEDATSVTIRRTTRSTGPHPRPHVAVRTRTDPAAIAALVDLVNALPGAMTAPFVASCPDTVNARSYALTFATPRGSYVATLASASCWPQVTLQRDGAAVGPPLEPGRQFTRTADHFLE